MMKRLSEEWSVNSSCERYSTRLSSIARREDNDEIEVGFAKLGDADIKTLSSATHYIRLNLPYFARSSWRPRARLEAI
jgi:hypothetical protein